MKARGFSERVAADEARPASRASSYTVRALAGRAPQTEAVWRTHDQAKSLHPTSKPLLPILALLVVGLACGPAAGAPTPTAAPSAPVLPSMSPTGDRPFTISVEYAILGVAEEYAAAGVSYAKLQDVFVIWENVEPEPGEYHWGPLDAIVSEYQQAGFTGLQMDFTAKSPWASSREPSLGDQGDTFPKEEYLDDYVAYVSAVVERYDNDGVDDMPGLVSPIHDYGIEREFTGYWPGSAEEYVRLLRLSYPAIKAADPDARVLLVALLMADVFDGNPTQDEIERRLTRDIDYMRKSVPEIGAILAACDAYDIVDFHALANYTEIPLTAAWIRGELQSNGCGEKPIWIGDAFPMSGMVGFGGFVPPTPFSPVTLETREAVVELLKSVADPSSPDHDAARAWLYGEAAVGLVRKIVVSAGEGLLGINIGNMEDWKTGTAAIDKGTVPMLGASMFMGMTDTRVTNRMPGGELPLNGKHWAKAREASNRRPAFYALQLVNGKIGDFTSVRKLDLGEGIWAYEFETPQGPVWALWYDDGQLYLPGQTPPSVEVQLPFDAAQSIVSLTPSEFGTTEPATSVVDSSAGALSIVLDSVPIFVEAAP